MTTFTPLHSSYRPRRSASYGSASTAAPYQAYGAPSAAERLRPSHAPLQRPLQRASQNTRRAVSGAGRTGRASLVRYATDNAVVRAFDTFTTGAYRFAFYAIVVLVAGASLYVPLRGWYVAERSKEIKNNLYEQQLAINAREQETVDKLLSQEGIKDIARSKLGMVEPGEVSGVVVGLDDQKAADEDAATANDTAASAKGEGAASDAASGDEDAQNAAAGAGNAKGQDADAQAAAPWYQNVLDAVFFFSLDDVQGLTTVSSGA